MKTNPDLHLAFDFVQYTNRHIFLTGKAGTGKTTFLHHMKQSVPKRMIVVAPTGVAAINAGGVTIHSFFQLPFHPHLPLQYLKTDPRQYENEIKNTGTYKISREKINIIKSIDLLVIDEISMVRADLLDAIDNVLRRYRDRNTPFGGIQLLMIGDIQQLAPVVKEDDREILDKYYNSYFFFGSLALQQTNYITIELKHIYRQQDQTFIRLLNNIRNNQIDQPVLEALNKRYQPEFKTEPDKEYITLTTHNFQAHNINKDKLDQINEKTAVFRAEVEGDFPDYSYPTMLELHLKKEAQVMFVKNDLSREKRYYNGKIGRITGFEDEKILITCSDQKSPIMVERAEWQNMKYTLDKNSGEIEETVIGTFLQYPLKLAWAITIHKSQGLTFDHVIIDAGSAFAFGQVYVALSRCRSLDGIVLSSKLDKKAIKNDPEVTSFTREAELYQPDTAMLNESKKAYTKKLITELFDFESAIRSIAYLIKVISQHEESIIGDVQEKLNNIMIMMKTDIKDVSDKFKVQWMRMFDAEPDIEKNHMLAERLVKACEFFSGNTEVIMNECSGISVNTDNKAVKKAANNALKEVLKNIEIKSACLNSCRENFSITKYLNAKAKASIEKPRAGSVVAKNIEDTSGIIKHPDLFSHLKAWRNKLANESQLPHYMILPQKTMVTLSNLLPMDMPALQAVKGMGKKKTGTYGEDIISMIKAYCRLHNLEPEPFIIPEEKQKTKSRTDTKRISLELFKEGKSPVQIAEDRSLALSTIEGHLAHFVGIGELSVHDFVDPRKIDMIAAHYDNNEDLSLKGAKEALGDKVTWSEVRYVAKHIEMLRKK